MADVSFIGLGAMGFALADTAAKSGRETVVWNRTRGKALPLVERNATIASSPAEAISASPLVVVCVSDYETSNALLGTNDCVSALKGRVLVQLSSGSPRLARAALESSKQAGISYLDGEIAAYTDQIGRADAQILIAGDEEAYSTAESLLKTLAPQTRYLGADPAKSSALNLAILSGSVGLIAGIINGAAICEAAGISPLEFGRDLPQLVMADVDSIAESMEKIENGGLEITDAPIEGWAAIIDLMIQFAEENGYSADVSKFIRQFFGQAANQGFGSHDVGALIHVLRPGKD